MLVVCARQLVIVHSAVHIRRYVILFSLCICAVDLNWPKSNRQFLLFVSARVTFMSMCETIASAVLFAHEP